MRRQRIHDRHPAAGPMSWTSSLAITVAMCVVSLCSSVTRADEATCGSLENAFGPFDYRDPVARGEPLYLVEKAHFTAQVENLVRGQEGYLWQDLDYTLRAFPNHHRALYSVSRYGISRSSRELRRPVECYFERALRFRPDDAVVYLVQGIYLVRINKREEGIQSYKRAIQLQPDLAEAHYNLGLELLKAGELKQANQHAQIAYRIGYPLPGLRSQLVAKGAWDPDAAPLP